MWIGGREVVLRESFLIGDNEEARMTTTVGGQPLTILIRFITGGEGQPSSKARIDWDTTTIPGTVKFTAYDWKNPFGTTTVEPIRLGEVGDGRPFGFQLVQWRIGNMNRADFFLLVGGEYGKPDKPQA